MEREKMLDLWRKEFEQGYHNFQLPPTVYDYFDEKADKPFHDSYTPRKWYASYEKWIIKELDGENDGLARRMLYVISRIRSQGLIYQYGLEEELDICIRIGYDFETILKAVSKLSRDIDIKLLYRIAETLATHYPKEAEEFAGGLLTSAIEKMISSRKSSYELYLAFYIALTLVQKDPEKGRPYLPVILSHMQKYKSKYMTALSYYGRDIYPELKALLVEQINSNMATAGIWTEVMKPDELLPFLKQSGTDLWVYYYLVVKQSIRIKGRSRIIKDLYQEDKKTFMQLFEQLVKSNDRMNLVWAGYLQAILLKDGAAGEMDHSSIIVLSALKGLFNESCEDQNYSFTDLTDETVPLSSLDYKLHFRNFWWSHNATEYLEVLSLLYDYQIKARRLFEVLFHKMVRTQNSYDNKDIAVCYFVGARKDWLDIPMDESLKLLLQPDTGYTIEDVFQTYCFAQNSYRSDSVGGFVEVMTSDVVQNNQHIVLDTLKKKDVNVEQLLTLIDLAYVEYNIADYQSLIDLLSNKSKQVRKRAEELLIELEEPVRPLIEAQMDKWKVEPRAIAKRLFKRWDNDRKYGADFAFTNNQMVTDFCTDNYDGENHRFISWIPEDMLMDIRFADLNEKAPVVVMKYILSEYLSQEESVRIKICDMVTAQLCPSDLQAALENIYRFWLDKGAEAKKKMIMVPYCIYASDSQILKLRTQLKDWAEASRGAIAAFVVNAIALNGGSVALVMIDGMSIKFPNNQVKNAAKAAFSFAAKALGIPEDELSDKIVPTLGFNREGEKVLDYGPRTFTVTLMPDFSLTIYDNDKQKTIKSMPAPGANDDTVKATAAKKEFSELKKQIKATVQAQTNRLEKVLMNGRQWNVDAWQTLFVENPIMHRFAMGLIWGIYEDGNLTDTFRYMEDGTFNTVDEDEYILPEKAFISLVHPVELTPEQLAQWKEQLDDYEIVQPLPQLTAPVVEPADKDVADKKVIRYKGVVILAGKIAGMARKHNMVRGDVLDGGSFVVFHWIDKYLNIDVLLNFEYMWMGQEYNENVTLGDVTFYTLGEEQGITDEPEEKRIVPPSSLPARLVSTVLGTFDQLVEQ